MPSPNKYPGNCPVCGNRVKAQEGYVILDDEATKRAGKKKWLNYHRECYVNRHHANKTAAEAAAVEPSEVANDGPDDRYVNVALYGLF